MAQQRPNKAYKKSAEFAVEITPTLFWPPIRIPATQLLLLGELSLSLFKWQSWLVLHKVISNFTFRNKMPFVEITLLPYTQLDSKRHLMPEKEVHSRTLECTEVSDRIHFNNSYKIGLCKGIVNVTELSSNNLIQVTTNFTQYVFPSCCCSPRQEELPSVRFRCLC